MTSSVDNAPPAISFPIGTNPWVEECHQRTAAALYQARSAGQEELSQCITIAREANKRGMPADILEVLARLKGTEEEHLSEAISELSQQVAVYVSPQAVLIPFAGKLITPTAFYEGFPLLKEMAKFLLSPVIYAEDTDAIGIASINPVACQMAGERISEFVYQKNGIRPFITIARLDYETWSFLTRKHFEL